MDAIIQQKVKNELNREVARIGLVDRGFIVSFSDIPPLLTADDVAYGNVNWINATMTLNKLPKVDCGYVPSVLQPFGLPSNLLPTEEAFKLTNCFIKPPGEHHKAFNGFVVGTDTSITMLNLANYTGTHVITNPVIEILSEWRCFVLNGEVLDARCYKGNFRFTPYWRIVDDIAKEFKTLDAWSFDVAVTQKELTLIIEMHEVYSLGTYGVNPSTFAALLEAAWNQKWKQHDQNHK